MDQIKYIQTIITDSIQLKTLVTKTLAPTIVAASQMLVKCIREGGKILSCGNGGSACDAGHFTAELVNRFLMEREGLAAVTLNADTALLTAIANDYSYQDIFARQIKTLGKRGDLLLAISTSGNSPNIIEAIHAAHACNMPVIALTGKEGGVVATVLAAGDLEIRVPSAVTPRIQEVHVLIIHCLCDLLERTLFKKVEK